VIDFYRFCNAKILAGKGAGQYAIGEWRDKLGKNLGGASPFGQLPLIQD